MKPWIWLRVAAVLQALGAVLHTIATTNPPSRGQAEETVFAAMQAFHFQIMKANRSHWDFYRGYELSITVVFAILAVLIWQLSNMSKAEPRQAAPLVVTILVAEILLSAVGWEYFFAGPGGMSILIAACLAAAVFCAQKERPAGARDRPGSKSRLTGAAPSFGLRHVRLLFPTMGKKGSDLSSGLLRFAQNDTNKVLTGRSPHLLILNKVQGLAPAQGGVKPTVGFAYN